jgi:hypothetical protein
MKKNLGLAIYPHFGQGVAGATPMACKALNKLLGRFRHEAVMLDLI